MSGGPSDVVWTVAVAGGCEVAERPVWDAHSRTVVWVDVTAGTLHRAALPVTSPGLWEDQSVSVGETLGAAALRRDGGLVVAADSAFLLLDSRGCLDGDPIAVDMPDGARFNDAACDPAGRFVAGTTSAERNPAAGVLWSLAPSGGLTTLLDGVVESNGLDWSPDGTVLYYVDSGEPVVRRYRYDCELGCLGERLTDLAVIEVGGGVPDGLVLDADGAVWLALWEGAAIRRYSPAGELLAHLDTPVSQPTCPGFAGSQLNLLMLTTAWEGLSSKRRDEEPWAGDVLVASVSVTGRLPHRFAGSPR